VDGVNYSCGESASRPAIQPVIYSPVSLNHGQILGYLSPRWCVGFSHQALDQNYKSWIDRLGPTDESWRAKRDVPLKGSDSSLLLKISRCWHRDGLRKTSRDRLEAVERHNNRLETKRHNIWWPSTNCLLHPLIGQVHLQCMLVTVIMLGVVKFKIWQWVNTKS
jgi:hypothetical protein